MTRIRATCPSCGEVELRPDEIELQIVHPETQNLHPGSMEIIERVGIDHPRIKPELTQSTIEVITGICDTVPQAHADLLGSLRELYDVGDELGFTYTSAGTHPFAHWSQQKTYPNERYNKLVERVQWAARRLLIYGVHVHVGVASGERAIAIGNAMTSYLPHLLALSASSPYNDGEDTGLSSCRVKIFEVMPTAGLPYRLANYGEFQAFMNALLSARAIESIREIWWDIRPHPAFGTVEVRICDAPSTLTEASAIVALAHCLIVYLDRMYERGCIERLLHPWIVRENKWRATRYGLDAEIIIENNGAQIALRDDLEQAITLLTPLSEELGCAAELQHVRHMLVAGTSSSRQRRYFQESGDLRAVVRELAGELRSDVFGTSRAPATARTGTS